jgi:hypothetical protein
MVAHVVFEERVVPDDRRRALRHAAIVARRLEAYSGVISPTGGPHRE